VAGEVFLGDLIIRSSKNPDIPNTPNPNIPKEAGTELSSSPPEAQAGALQAVSSQPSTSQSPGVEEEPAVSRLRSYAAFRERVPPLRLSHQASTSNILAHLPDRIDEDPAEYSYRATNDRLKLVEQEVAAQSLDPRERRKATRQAARLQKRLEKTAKIGQEVMMQQRMLPGVASLGRGIGLPGREIQSSQVAVPDSSQGLGQSQVIPGLTMTQPERGAFGTRPMKMKAKVKGTKRRAGF
jgi:RNA polymerase I-specific transcription initiation factor RRN6